jgi:phage-related protein
MAVTNAITDLFKSIYELFASVLGAIYHTLHSIVMAVVGLFSGFVQLVADIFQGAFDVVGGVGKFVISECIRTSKQHHVLILSKH